MPTGKATLRQKPVSANVLAAGLFASVITGPLAQAGASAAVCGLATEGLGLRHPASSFSNRSILALISARPAFQSALSNAT